METEGQVPAQGCEIFKAVADVQRAVVVPKARYNSFGKFSYRSFEDIVAALKEPCRAAGLAFCLSDDVKCVNGRWYVEATATVFFTDGRSGSLSAHAYAREAEHKTGSDDAQVTGMASSYARKYALCGLFAIDGTSDPDASEGAPKASKEPPAQGGFNARCQSCGTRYRFDSREAFEAWKPTATCCPAPDWRVE